MSESDIERINKTSMDRLTEKLRRRVDHMINMEASHTKTLEWEAADLITALRAEVEKLRAALEGFVCDCEGKQICIGSCQHKNARAALGDTHE